MKSKSTLTVLTIVILILYRCDSNVNTKAKIVNEQNDVLQVITITKIKKPWYAPKGVVIKKMKETIPIYRKVDGLIEKNYSFADGTTFFGGIYHWSKAESAESWFNDKWFANIKSKYGVDGIVEYYNVVKQTVYLEISQENQKMWVVLDYDTQEHLDKQDDLVQVIKCKDETENNLVFTFWMNESKAKDYLKNQSKAKLMLLPVTIYNK